MSIVVLRIQNRHSEFVEQEVFRAGSNTELTYVIFIHFQIFTRLRNLCSSRCHHYFFFFLRNAHFSYFFDYRIESGYLQNVYL